MELADTDLIRNSLHTQWNMEVQDTSNYSLGEAYNNVSKLGHADLYRGLSVRVWK